MSKQKIILIMPAYNAGKTIAKTVKKVPKKIVHEIIVVDDASTDNTASVVKKLGLRLIIHSQNKGYGGNQKTCYKEALDRKADVVVMLHPDYQYDPTYIPYLIKPIIDGSFDIMLGSRIRSRAEVLEGGMPLYKYISNRVLTFIENIVLGLNLSEYHTGYRAFNKKVLRSVPIDSYSDDFVFDQQILITAQTKNFKIGEIFVPCIYNKESSSINFIRSVKYGIDILINLGLYIILRKKYFAQKSRSQKSLKKT